LNANGVPLAGCQDQILFATYAGPQGLFPELDQLNLNIPQQVKRVWSAIFLYTSTGSLEGLFSTSEDQHMGNG
jgi:hypothetical protein